MSVHIHRNTVNDLLWNTLVKLMRLEKLANFRLVGGTSLSLLLGHRKSVDIDMFTDAEYGTIDFLDILKTLKAEFQFIDGHNTWINKTAGNSCFIGESHLNTVKLDLFYTDPFFYPIILYEGIRLASLEEIVAMKLDVIGRGGRKKDFWDIHELFDSFELSTMLDIYSKCYPYHFSKDELIKQLTNFENADNDFEPNCLKGKYWELIKLDFEEKIKDFN